MPTMTLPPGLRPHKDLDASALLEAVVRIPSPTGHEAAAVAFMQEQARLDGFQVDEDSAGNFIARKNGTGPHIVFVGHIDTVPGEIPVRIEAGELWGRGSVDAKGCLVAAYCAARESDARITIVGAVDEEGRSAGAQALELEDPACIIIGEPSGSDGLTLGYKGILRGSFRFDTPAAHGGHPGANAMDLALDWWNDVAALHAGYGFDDITCRMDTIHGATHPDTHCTGTFQIRTPPGTDVAWLSQQLQSNDGTVLIEEAWPAVVMDRRDRLAAAFTGAIRASGATPRHLRKTGTCDMNVLAGRYPDAPMVAYGPGDSSLDHTLVERLPLAELREAIAILATVFASFEASS